MKDLKTGITLGILGGGQLGRMSALAAARLGIDVVIFCPDLKSPASFVARETIIAAYDDHNALKAFSDKVDVISYEFENIPIETIDYIESLGKCRIYPEKTLLDVSQDRMKEKKFLNSLGIETARWAEISTIDTVKKSLIAWKINEFILKTTRFGYDGKGQIKGNVQALDQTPDIQNFLKTHQNTPLIMEDMINFSHEISVIIARDMKGKTVTYGAMLNEHKNHILHRTIVPAPLPRAVCDKACAMAERVADAVNLVGVLTVEFFVCPDGRVLANEIAPRTHNSGHWSIDACAVSQFEQHVRAVCGLPVGSPARHSDAEMLNLIGDDIDTIAPYLTQDLTCLHLYGKHEARQGRKMGHVTFLKPKTDPHA